MAHDDLRAVALFFYFSLLDDQVALRATERALKKLAPASPSPAQAGGQDGAALARENIVRVCTALWKKYERFTVRGGSGPTPASHWRLPEILDLAPWRQFQREGLSEDMLAVVWSKILGFSEVDVGRGLGLSPGTVRYRVARGVRQLGQTNRLGKYVGI